MSNELGGKLMKGEKKWKGIKVKVEVEVEMARGVRRMPFGLVRNCQTGEQRSIG